MLVLAGLFFIFASGRFVPGQAIMTLAVPASRRGAFMSLSGCARDLAAGLSSSVGGWIVAKAPSGELVNYGWLGWMAVVAALFSLWLAHQVRVNESDTSVGVRFEPATPRRAPRKRWLFTLHPQPSTEYEEP